MEKDREERKECVKWSNFYGIPQSGICKLFVLCEQRKTCLCFMHVWRFLWNGRESCFKCMVSISVSVAEYVWVISKSSEWQEEAIYCISVGRELWWMFHVEFSLIYATLLWKIKHANHYRAKGWREKGRSDPLTSSGLVYSSSPKVVVWSLFTEWLLLTFVVCQQIVITFILWQPGCCNLRTWTTGCLKHFNQADLNGNRMEMQIRRVFLSGTV